MNISFILSSITTLIACAVSYSIAWGIQGAKITELELNHANERIAIQRSARQTFERYSSQVTAAQNEAASRAAVLARERDDNARALERLRNSSSATVRASADSPATCRSAVTTFDVVFAECSTRLTALAEDADRCVTDTQALIRGWPK